MSKSKQNKKTHFLFHQLKLRSKPLAYKYPINNFSIVFLSSRHKFDGSSWFSLFFPSRFNPSPSSIS